LVDAHAWSVLGRKQVTTVEGERLLFGQAVAVHQYVDNAIWQQCWDKTEPLPAEVTKRMPELVKTNVLAGLDAFDIFQK
jgi:hypothetical protein